MWVTWLEISTAFSKMNTCRVTGTHINYKFGNISKRYQTESLIITTDYRPLIGSEFG